MQVLRAWSGFRTNKAAAFSRTSRTAWGRRPRRWCRWANTCCADRGALMRCGRRRGCRCWGNIGAADRLDFTAIGPAVNLVSRLEGLCRPLGRSVLISGAVAAQTTTPLVPLGEHVLRGIAVPCAVFTLPDA